LIVWNHVDQGKEDQEEEIMIIQCLTEGDSSLFGDHKF
jgi:hypothetical protein